MKKSGKILLTLIVLVSIGLTYSACKKKLPDGGKAKKSQLAGVWEVSTFTCDGINLLSRSNQDTIILGATGCTDTLPSTVDTFVGVIDTVLKTFTWTFGKDGDFDYTRTWTRKTIDATKTGNDCKFTTTTINEGNNDAGRWDFFADNTKIELRHNEGYFGGIFPTMDVFPEIWTLLQLKKGEMKWERVADAKKYEITLTAVE